MTQPIKVFCSYRSVDRTEVNAFVDKLLAAGLDAWFDRYEIAAGDDIVQRMGEELTDSTELTRCDESGLSRGPSRDGSARPTGLRTRRSETTRLALATLAR